MTKMIKIMEGVNITIDGETEFHTGFAGVWEHFPAMAGKEYDDAKTEIVRALIVKGGYLDLSEAFAPHKVELEIVRCPDEMKECNA